MSHVSKILVAVFTYIHMYMCVYIYAYVCVCIHKYIITYKGYLSRRRKQSASSPVSAIQQGFHSACSITRVQSLRQHKSRHQSHFPSFSKVRPLPQCGGTCHNSRTQEGASQGISSRPAWATHQDLDSNKPKQNRIKWENHPNLSPAAEPSEMPFF